MLLNVVAIFSTLLFSLAFADTSSTIRSTSTSSAPVATHTVAVGAVSGPSHRGWIVS
jgi:hypothetical protein